MEDTVLLTPADEAYGTFYRIHSSRLDTFMAKFDSMNKRAAKMGCFPVRVEVLGEMIRVKDAKKGEVDAYTCVTIEGEAPSFNGWTFIATLEHIGDANIVRNAPGKETPTHYRSVDNLCEHCNSRRRRRETFILLHEDGTYKQVGRTCIKDFLDGHSNPEAYARWFDMLGKLEEEAESAWTSNGGGERCFLAETYMAFVVECIERFGWVSGTYAKEQREYYDNFVEATAWRALRNMTPVSKHDFKNLDFEQPSDESYEKAKVVLAWGKSLKEQDDLNDYKHNLSVIAGISYITFNKLSFAASMANAYEMELKNIEYKERVKKEKEERYAGEYVGVVGKRQEFTVTIERVIKFENQFGVTKFHIMKDAADNTLVWYASNNHLEEGEEYTLKATVKEHKEYEGIYQTVLTRCAVI